MHRILLVVAALRVPTALVSQRLPPIPVHATFSLKAPLPAAHFDHGLADSAVAIPPTYWLEGGVIGAITVGVLGTLWFQGMSESSQSFGSTVAVGLLCGAVGFAPGALIGGQFRQSTKTRAHLP